MPVGIDDVAWVGGSWDPDFLISAYGKGWFPWPEKHQPILWFCPNPRAILNFKDFHLSRSTWKSFAKKNWSVSFNQDFASVMRACAQVPRPDQAGTWILPEMYPAYQALHQKGQAFSVEVWNSSQELIGGVYGVKSATYFGAESMFHIASDASKFALWQCTEHLKTQGVDWMDIQVLNPFTARLGGCEISRPDFLQRINRLHNPPLR